MRDHAATRAVPSLYAVLLLSSWPASARAELDVGSRGELGFESRLFYPDDTEASDIGNVAMVGRLQVDAEVDALDELSARARVFSRLDPYDDARTRIVPEEVYLNAELDPLRLRIGYQMLNWTATEAFHPADIINSRILDGSFENPEKIGEPIAALRLDIPAGNVELYAMPVFTAPVLPSARSPLSLSGPELALGDALVLERDGEVTDRRFQPQWGARVQQTWGSADVSVHVVQHIDRTTPIVAFDAAAGVARPLFQALTQIGGTYQHAVDATLLKIEAAYRVFERPESGMTALGPVPRRNHVLAAAGIEHSLSRGDGSDTAFILEGQVLIPTQADYPKLLEPLFQHDVLVGVRHAWNDEQSTTLLVTAIVDVEHRDQLVFGAAIGRRLGEAWGLSTGLRFLRFPPEVSAAPVLFEHLHDAHHVYLDLKRYF